MLQARSERPEVAHPLLKAADRISSISDLHTMLYQQEKHDTVQLQPYLGSLVERLSSSLLEGDRVAIEIGCDPVEVSAEQAVSLGLIVNELVTNAVKHAFQDGRRGRVRVTARGGESGVLLQVEDNGSGMSGLPDEGLGMRLINSLAADLGVVNWTTGSGGTVVELHCARPPDPKAS
jgi:two-component sensor histidine kinase